jgi:serpin B
MDPYAYAEGPGYQAIELPYYGEEFSMVLFLPGEGEFDAFEQALSPEMLQGILGDLELTSLSLRMPKFEFESEFSLVKVLDELGMPSAFNEEANFSAMDGTRNLLISDVVHKAFVAVDESGTEAAAATAVIVAEMSIEITEVEMHMDRPFIFSIRDNNTGTLLFLGRVLNPTS